MRRFLSLPLLITVLVSPVAVELTVGTPEFTSMSALEFAPDGTLFIGDSKAGRVVAVAMDEAAPAELPERLQVSDVEAKVAAVLGTTASEVMIHDLAVHPISKNIHIAVSRSRGAWDNRWDLPNDLGDARVLLRIHPDGTIDEADLTDVGHAIMELPHPVDVGTPHRWKENATVRGDAITDLSYHDGTLYVAGLSNQEFAAAMWQVPYPFQGTPRISTLEVFHGAHGAYETHAPVRTFLPYTLSGELHILASYLCTPLATFAVDALADGSHVRGRTVAEFGSGNYPLDMVACEVEGKEFIVVANSMLPLLTFDPGAVPGQESIETEVTAYTGGLPYTARAGSGIQQLDNFDADSLVGLQRMPSGKLDLVQLSERRLAL